ncbi:hypothetical protein BG015_000217 [Linnemannia schmuckeri]|uniref:Uncharacterized protein n=1 Tax=Linnemannia schmuckeri TaxID=64567 RepID=A0A9P5S6V7_9FUNG|nr:hypothetical protein BG015_000217 [Linnemannia schmuckeri]
MHGPIAIVLSMLAICANAAYYILDVQHLPEETISARGTLRYVGNDYLPVYKECKETSGLQIEQGHLGGSSPPCPDTNVRIGLYFPRGYNGTISEVYDYHNKIFYPCVRINKEDSMESFACSNILMIDLHPNGPN